MKQGPILLVILLILIAGIYIGHHFTFVSTLVKKPLYWIDTMEPLVHYPGPGKSHMGMELVPVYPDALNKQKTESTVQVSPTVVNNLSVRTAPVMQGALSQKIDTVGYVMPNENKISHIHSYADGWVRKLYVNTIGEPVKKDQVLLQLYSPVLINAQDEYLLAVHNKDKELIDASLKRLDAFHFTQQQIQRLTDTKKSEQLIDMVSPQNGVVTELNVREGMRVTPETEMIHLVDLSNVWVMAQVVESQASWVKVGEPAEVKISGYPDKVWKGNVDYIYPEIDPTTRTLKVRFLFDNSDGVLKPNMYTNVSLFAQPKNQALSIPQEALIRSSKGDRVIVALGDGSFQVRPVTVGIESGDQVEILSGLKAGERVVISGQFLIDSEANLESSLERMSKE